MPARAFKLFFVKKLLPTNANSVANQIHLLSRSQPDQSKNYCYMRKKLTSVFCSILKCKKNQLVFLLVFQFAVFINGYSQSVTVKGVVQDEKGSALAGATVAVKGTVSSVVTDNAGKYSITVPGAQAVLGFSFINYTSLEEIVAQRNSINVTMYASATNLEDVVVVGYGTQRKAELTGSVSSLKGDKIREMPVITVEQALQGRMAGVQVQQTSGQPGAGISLRIRGVTSIAGGNEPLYVIDGL